MNKILEPNNRIGLILTNIVEVLFLSACLFIALFKLVDVIASKSGVLLNVIFYSIFLLIVFLVIYLLERLKRAFMGEEYYQQYERECEIEDKKRFVNEYYSKYEQDREKYFKYKKDITNFEKSNKIVLG